MKKYYFLLLSTGISLFTNAQTGSEWFRQKKTKINYLVEQIAALKVCSEYASKGYSIAKQGLTDVGDIKRSDLTMHGDYFASLRDVNPVIKNYAKVGQIIALQAGILKLYQQQKKAVHNRDQLTGGEAKYIDKVLTGLLAGCADLVDELIILTTDNSSEMKDDERITRIDTLYADLQDKYSFMKNFVAETNVLMIQRQGEGSDIKTSNSLFGVHY